MSEVQENLKKVISHFGNQTKLAKHLNISRQTVNNWLHGRENMSLLYALKIEKLTKGKFEQTLFLSPENLFYIMQKQT
jgi:DNA-binding transcriptional regulator YdaS (Cro superfamily)